MVFTGTENGIFINNRLSLGDHFSNTLVIVDIKYREFKTAHCENKFPSYVLVKKNERIFNIEICTKPIVCLIAFMTMSWRHCVNKPVTNSLSADNDAS